MKQPNNPLWKRTPVKWEDFSDEGKRNFQKFSVMRRTKTGKVYLSPRGRAYYIDKDEQPQKRIGRDVYIQTPRPAIRRKKRGRGYLILVAAILILWAGAYLAGQVLGYLDFHRRPRPTYYISPVGSMDDVRVFKLDHEAVILSAHDEVYYEGEFISTDEYRGLVRKAEAKEPEEKTVEELITEKFGDKSKIALAVARCESGLRENAIGDTHIYPHSYGVFQVRAFPNRPTVDDLLTAEKNIDYAYTLSKGGTTWLHWTCFTKGYYKKHL